MKNWVCCSIFSTFHELLITDPCKHVKGCSWLKKKADFVLKIKGFVLNRIQKYKLLYFIFQMWLYKLYLCYLMSKKGGIMLLFSIT